MFLQPVIERSLAMKKRTQASGDARSSLTKKWTVGGVAVAVLAIGMSIAMGKGVFSSSTEKESAPSPPAESVATTKVSAVSTTGTGGAGLAAMEQAAADSKYLFAFFSTNNNAQTMAMKKVFDEATAKVADRALTVAVNITDPAERGLIKKFDLDRAPMPLVLAIAPNGAIMGGFPTKFEVNDLLNAFGSPCTEKCMKSLQDGKLVLLCVQNSATTSNAEALQGVNEFKADEKYAAATEIVMLDPTDAAEASFLSDLKIDPKITVATTAFLAPPGSVITEVEGPTTKEVLVTALQQANTGCGPGGCGPGGCAPK